MGRQIRVIGVKRKEIDEEKLALAFLLLARSLHDQKQPSSAGESTSNQASDEAEGA